jgi:hypothetical protein
MSNRVAVAKFKAHPATRQRLDCVCFSTAFEARRIGRHSQFLITHDLPRGKAAVNRAQSRRFAKFEHIWKSAPTS